jgi:hypothetical protein
MKYKTSELTSELLDAAVATALGMKTGIRNASTRVPIFKTYQTGGLDCGPSESDCGDVFEPSRLWGHGGPIIERERIALEFYGAYWGAMPKDVTGCEVPDLDAKKHKQMSGGWCPVMATGDSPLVAAMRAFVLARMGDEVDL